MKSFKQQILLLEQSDWDYYHNLDDKILDNPFSKKNYHEKFVRKYFARSGKHKILEFISLLPNQKLSYSRIKHTNSIFFLGILLYKNTGLENDYLEEYNTAEYRRFPFLWFLTCLFHDFGFTIENDVKAINGISNLEDLKTKHKINNDLLKESLPKVDKILFQNIEKYFNKRLIEDGVIDHGIFGGIYFYDKLLQIRAQKELKNNNNLFWGKELIEQYAYASSAIAVHNIWLPTKKTETLYRKYDMDSLIEKFNPISFNNFPLLYILGIVDTIDPIKAYKNSGKPADYILRNTLFEFKKDRLVIKNNKESELDFNEILKRAKNLENWLNVRMKISTNKIQIELI